MPKKCELTGKIPMKGHNVSHANNKTKRRFLPNLKKVRFKSIILKNNIKIIGVGGVDSGQSAYQKIISGANLVQLYTGMIYQGPSIVSKISQELINILDKEGVKNISDAVGSKN